MTNPTHAPADMLDALLPCPFCGATPHKGPTKMMTGQDGEPFHRYRVWCPHGHAAFEEMSAVLAVTAWNRRASLPAGNEPVALRWDNLDGTSSWATIAPLWMCYRVALRSDGMKVLRLEWLGNRTDELGLFGTWDEARTAAQGDLNARLRPLYASPFTPAEGETDALADVAAERERQKVVEGWGTAHDDAHENGEMALAAIAYAAVPGIEIKAHGWVPCGCRSVGECNHWGGRVQAWVDPWPWDAKWWKPTDRRRDLVKAGALILAEIERLDRAASRPTPSGPDLTKTERFLLDWLAKEDVSALRECYGPDLDRLVALGFAQIEGQRVSLTEAGVNAAKPTPGGEKGNG